MSLQRYSVVTYIRGITIVTMFCNWERVDQRCSWKDSQLFVAGESPRRKSPRWSSTRRLTLTWNPPSIVDVKPSIMRRSFISTGVISKTGSSAAHMATNSYVASWFPGLEEFPLSVIQHSQARILTHHNRGPAPNAWNFGAGGLANCPCSSRCRPGLNSSESSPHTYDTPSQERIGR